jgi:Tetracyclin repressor-like, C-terminal domain
VTTQNFKEKGLAGVRTDEIAECAHEQADCRLRAKKADLHLDNPKPIAAFLRWVEFTFDHYAGNGDCSRPVMNENINRAEFISSSKSI